jgi:competence protein ComEC
MPAIRPKSPKSLPNNLTISTRWILGLLLLAIITTFALLTFSPSQDQLQLIFCDVGQGDATIIQYQNTQTLIDGGPNTQVINCLDQHLPLGDKTIELVILTHPQADHLSGLIEIFDYYQVQRFALPPVGNTTASYQALLDQFTTHPQVQLINLYAGDQLQLTPQVQATVLWPDRRWAAAHLAQGSIDLDSSHPVLGATTTSDLNDFSLVLHLQYGDFDVLLTGDADRYIQDDILATSLTPSQIEILKIPHHGSATGLLTEFLTQTSPQLSVISVGKNSYGHPSQDLINQLQQNGSKVLTTDQHGDINILSNSHHWWVEE